MIKLNTLAVLLITLFIIFGTNGSVHATTLYPQDYVPGNPILVAYGFKNITESSNFQFLIDDYERQNDADLPDLPNTYYKIEEGYFPEDVDGTILKKIFREQSDASKKTVKYDTYSTQEYSLKTQIKELTKKMKKNK